MRAAVTVAPAHINHMFSGGLDQEIDAKDSAAHEMMAKYYQSQGQWEKSYQIYFSYESEALQNKRINTHIDASSIKLFSVLDSQKLNQKCQQSGQV